MILDRLYNEDCAKAAMEWIWANIADLTTPGVLPTAVPVVSYIASHAAKRWIPDEDGTVSMTTAESAEWNEKAKQLCEHFEVNASEGVEGVVGAPGGGLLAKALAILVKKLIEELLKNQS